ncbi:unnamed protein product [Ascophyllum nodosum]
MEMGRLTRGGTAENTSREIKLPDYDTLVEWALASIIAGDGAGAARLPTRRK